MGEGTMAILEFKELQHNVRYVLQCSRYLSEIGGSISRVPS